MEVPVSWREVHRACADYERGMLDPGTAKAMNFP
jgi:hypothetical protein